MRRALSFAIMAAMAAAPLARAQEEAAAGCHAQNSGAGDAKRMRPGVCADGGTGEWIQDRRLRWHNEALLHQHLQDAKCKSKYG